MRTRVAKWGNSLALRLPKAVTVSLELDEGTEVELTEREGTIILQPARGRYRLPDLLNAIRPGNLHEPVDTGAPRGREAW